MPHFAPLGSLLQEVYLSTLVYVSLFVWLVANIKLYPGSFTLMWLVHGTFTAFLRGSYYWLIVPALLTGIFLDVIYRWIRPYRKTRSRLMLWAGAVAALTWCSYYLVVLVSKVGGGLALGGYAWVGGVFYATLIGFGLGFLATIQISPRQLGHENL